MVDLCESQEQQLLKPSQKMNAFIHSDFVPRRRLFQKAKEMEALRAKYPLPQLLRLFRSGKIQVPSGATAHDVNTLRVASASVQRVQEDSQHWGEEARR